jgi:sulfur carrier protein ThiS
VTGVKALLLPQNRTVELPGRRRVGDILATLQIIPGTVMVIRGDSLLTDAEMVEASEEVEIRSVISGGAPTNEPVLGR